MELNWLQKQAKWNVRLSRSALCRDQNMFPLLSETTFYLKEITWLTVVVIILSKQNCFVRPTDMLVRSTTGWTSCGDCILTCTYVNIRGRPAHPQIDKSQNRNGINSSEKRDKMRDDFCCSVCSFSRVIILAEFRKMKLSSDKSRVFYFVGWIKYILSVWNVILQLWI